MTSINTLLFGLLVACGSAFSGPTSNGISDLGRRYASLSEPLNLAGVPSTLHDPANKRLVELLEKRASCRIGEVTCSDGGCCPIGYYCDTVGGIPGCCQDGYTCNGSSGQCPYSNEVHCDASFGPYCCHSGETCVYDSAGNVKCAPTSGGGGGSSGGGSSGGGGGDGGSGNTSGSNNGNGSSGGSNDSGTGSNGGGSSGDQNDNPIPTSTTSSRSTTSTSYSLSIVHMTSATVAAIPTKSSSSTSSTAVSGFNSPASAAGRSWSPATSWVAGALGMIVAIPLFL